MYAKMIELTGFYMRWAFLTQGRVVPAGHGMLSSNTLHPDRTLQGGWQRCSNGAGGGGTPPTFESGGAYYIASPHFSGRFVLYKTIINVQFTDNVVIFKALNKFTQLSAYPILHDICISISDMSNSISDIFNSFADIRNRIADNVTK